MNSNPFNMVLTAIWDMLLACPSFVRDVKEGNRIRFDAKQRDPLKDPVQSSDLPEVCVAVSTATANIMDSSSTSKCTRNYTVMISSGDYRYSEILGNIEWYVWLALTGWKSKLAVLRWKDKNFVKRVNVTSVNTGLSDKSQNRNIAGWSAVWTLEVEMHFDTADLQAELQGDHAQQN